MTKLGLGILLLAAVHLFPAVAAGARTAIVRRHGEGPYKLAFTLATLAALYLIISGWKVASIEPVYAPPPWGGQVAALLVWIGFVMLPAPNLRSNISRVLRHPQLTGILLWSIGHLLANGETRSVWLFGGLGVWAIAEILLINRREGAWQRPEPVRRMADLRLIAVGTVLYVVVLYAHGWLFGVAPLASLP